MGSSLGVRDSGTILNVGIILHLLGPVAATPSIGYLSEDEFYILGNRFVDQANLAAAMVFELTGEYFPKSPLIFGGLGRVYLVRGDTLRAISAYERACDLAPYNGQAEAMLRRLRGR